MRKVEKVKPSISICESIEGADLSCENNDLHERLLECEKELENVRKKVEELEKKNETVVAVINMTNQMYMRLFDGMKAIIEKTISLLEQLPESIAKVAVEQLKKDLMETAKMLEKARKNFYVA